MKAMIIEQFGGPEVFKEDQVADPSPGYGQVVIRVAASSVNPIEVKIRSGMVPAVSPDFPAVLNGDVAGVIESVGDGVDDLNVGDEVYACGGGIKGLSGALCEYMVCDADLVELKPRSLSMVQAGVLPLVGITAWEALIDRARIGPGQRVLVHGGAGGVGHIGIQIAKNAGAIVYTTVSSEAKAKIAKGCGADFVINYKEQAVKDYVGQYTDGRGFDVVFDTVGGACLAGSFAAARTGGTVVTIAARSTQDLTPLHGKNLTLHCELMLVGLLSAAGRAHHGDILRNLGMFVDMGKIRPVVDPEEFIFANVGDAHRKLEAGKAVGKISLKAEFQD